MNLTPGQKIDNMSDEQLKAVWESFKYIMWNSKTMHDDNITMDEWGMMVDSEMTCRKLDKNW